MTLPPAPPDASFSDSQATNPIGRARPAARPQPSIPGYAIDRELGRGGMGVVYLAWQLGLNRPVAIKMMLAGAHASTEDLARFHHEIQTVARLHHPNIVQIYDVGQHEGLPYCALEYLGGGSLDDRLEGKPLGQRRAAALLLVLARAVQAAHEAGIVHRDLKPANILFAASTDERPTRRGPDATLSETWRAEDAKVADFGVAKRLGAVSGMTATQSVIGTPAYMAPEQASGRSREVGVAADVYSLGAILYELLTGRTPFTGEDILPQVLRQEPLPPSRLAPDLSRDLETICLKCLAKEPARRYVSAAALADDLDRYLHGQAIAARPVGRVEFAWRWCRRNPAVASLLATLALVIVVAFVGLTWLWRTAVAERSDKDAEARNAELARALADAERLKAEMHLGYSRIVQARFLWERHDLAGAQQLLAACPPEQREWEWHHLNGLCHSQLATATVSDWAWRTAVSPDGTRLVVVSGRPAEGKDQPPLTFHQYRLPTLAALAETPSGLVAPLHYFGFADDGRLVVVDGRHTVRLLAGDSLNVVWEQTKAERMQRGWVSEDGRWLLRAWDESGLRLWDLTTGKEGPSFSGQRHKIESAVASSAAQLVVAVDASGELFAWDLPTGQQLYRQEKIDQELAVSPNGKWLATKRGDREMRVLHARSGQLAWRDDVLTLSVEPIGVPQFSPDSRWLVATPVRWAPRVWEAATGKGGHCLRGHDGYSTKALAFSPDSRWVATCGTDRTIRLWHPGSGQEERIYRGHTAAVMHVAFSRDGRQLVSVSGGPHAGDHRVSLWDLTREQQALRLPPFTRYWAQTVWNTLLTFTPEGRLLVGYSPEGLAAFDASGVRREEWHFPCSQLTWREWHGMEVTADARFVVGRTDENGTVTRLDLRSRQKRSFNVGEAVRTVAISPNGRLVAAGTRTGRLLLWDVETDRLAFNQEVGRVVRLVFDAQGRRLAVGGRGVGWLDVETGTMHQLANELKGAVVGVAFHPTNSWLACTVESPGEIRLYDTATAQLVRSWTEGRLLGDVVFHPEGNRLAVASREGFVTLYDPHSGQEVLTLKALTGRDRDLAFPPRVAFSADGRRLAANDYQTRFWIWEADSWRNEAAPARRESTAEAAFAFHLHSAALAQELGRRGALGFHREQLQRLPTPSGRPLRELADLLAREQDWGALVTPLRRWLADHPEQTWLKDWPEPTELLALGLLLSGDDVGYRELCRRLARFVGDRDASDDDLVRLCSWGADALEPGRLTALVRRFREQRARDAFAQVMQGLAQYRAGAHAAAQANLEAAIASEKSDALIKGIGHLTLALLHQDCGRAEEARQHRQATTELERQFHSYRHPDHPNLTLWVALQALSAEVRKTVAR